MKEVNREDVHDMSPARIRWRAALFHLGNIVCMLAAVGAGTAYYMDGGLLSMVLSVALVLPTVLWFGISMALYALFAHDPNSLVSYHTKRAGYIFYGATGGLVLVLAFLQKVSFFYLLPIPAVVVGLVLLAGTRDLVAIWKADVASEPTGS